MGMKGGGTIFDDGVGVGSLPCGNGGDYDVGDGGGVVMIDGRFLASDLERRIDRSLHSDAIKEDFRCDRIIRFNDPGDEK